jgi:hypothetical protein
MGQVDTPWGRSRLALDRTALLDVGRRCEELVVVVKNRMDLTWIKATELDWPNESR